MNIPSVAQDSHFLNLEYIFYKISLWVTAVFTGSFPLFHYIYGLLTFVALVLIAILFYSWMRHRELVAAHAIKLADSIVIPEKIEPKNMRWLGIVDHSMSDRESDWRHAIIEADSVLDELLIARGYQGDGLGERLKNMPKGGALKNLDGAWEAHKVRNRIAHEGSMFSLSKPETRRVIGLYEEVFKELGFI